MLKLFVDGLQTDDLHIGNFPAGESIVRVSDKTSAPRWVSINMLYQSNEDLIDLALLVDAVRRKWKKLGTLDLMMPYVPYARQDRVCNPGESHSIRVIADFINSLKFDSVYIMDPHSDVTGALLNNAVIVGQHECAGRLAVCMPEDVVIVSPDAGANKKTFEFAKVFGFKDVARADKIRDTQTGQILETKLYADGIEGHAERDYVILDDICEGGRTFIELAKEIRKVTTGKVYLYVTHGIFSKGLEPLEPYFDQIYTANLMNESLRGNKLLTVF